MPAHHERGLCGSRAVPPLPLHHHNPTFCHWERHVSKRKERLKRVEKCPEVQASFLGRKWFIEETRIGKLRASFFRVGMEQIDQLGAT